MAYVNHGKELLQCTMRQLKGAVNLSPNDSRLLTGLMLSVMKGFFLTPKQLLAIRSIRKAYNLEDTHEKKISY